MSSDRTVFSTGSHEDRMYARYYRRQAQEREERALAFELVIGHVHPGNLGALPPSPATLQRKAQQLGLLA